MPRRRDVHPEVSIDREFERMLARAIVWVRANLTVILLAVAAVVVIAAAFVATYSARASQQAAILADLKRSADSPADSVEVLRDAADRAEGTPLATWALSTYANALCDVQAFDEARRIYESLSREPGENFLAWWAKLPHATTLEELGEKDQASRLYKEMLAESEGAFFAQRAIDRLAALVAPPATLPTRGTDTP